jgi:hypothetical protein
MTKHDLSVNIYAESSDPNESKAAILRSLDRLKCCVNCMSFENSIHFEWEEKSVK